MKTAAFLLSLATGALGLVVPRAPATSHPSQVDIASYTYGGITGPLHWDELDEKANSACAHGRYQSPIDIDPQDEHLGHSGPLDFTIPPSISAPFENLGSGLEVALKNGSLGLSDGKYALKQFHFHTPSEHRVNGEYYPMEVHFVFQSQNETAVVGFFFQLSETGTSFPLFHSIFNHIDEITQPGNVTESGPMAFAELAGHLNEHGIYNYTGSLTTPPCTEKVKWHVSQEPLALNVQDYNKVKDVLKFNSRYTQNRLGEKNLLERI